MVTHRARQTSPSHRIRGHTQAVEHCLSLKTEQTPAASLSLPNKQEPMASAQFALSSEWLKPKAEARFSTDSQGTAPPAEFLDILSPFSTVFF